MWLLFSFAAALLRTLKDIGFKIVLDTDPSSLDAVFVFWVAMLVFLLPAAFHKVRRRMRNRKKLAENRTLAFKALVGSALLNIAAYWMFMESLKRGDISVALPMRSIVPLFGFFIGLVILKEKIVGWTIVATIAVTLGVLLIHTREEAGRISMLEGVFGASSLLAAGSALIFAFCALLDRYGTAEQYGGLDAVVYSAGLILISALGFGIAVVFRGSMDHAFVLLERHWLILIPIGILGALGTFFTAKAFSVGEITKVIPALRLQVLLGVILGGAFFREEALWLRTIGAAILTIGIVLLALNPKKAV